MSVGDPEDGVVCWMTPDGNVICDRVLQAVECAPLAMFVASSDSESPDAKSRTSNQGSPNQSFVFPESWGPNKQELACRILEVLNLSTMPDESIPRRSGEIVDTVKRLLAPVPPSIMLYNYSTQPADVLGAYYLNKGDLVKMQQMFKIFEHPKQP
ncbi:MAG: hypothetical protein H7Z40_16345 [Phycisphaerae bacterium]|nr:hypothetical protein [Gemmatimonadaceae bacterium]